MSFTFPAALTAVLKNANVSLDWVMLIYYYNGVNRTNAIGLSSVDRIIGTQQYYGIVQDWGEIVNSIDLKESKASAGSFAITCSNKWKGGKFTDELYGGTNTYLNAKALVYMGETSDTTLANWQIIGEYRLTGISMSLTDVQLEFEERTPWDKVKLPIEKQANKYFPLIYGNFTPGTGWYSNTKPWPCPIYTMNYDQIACFLFTAATGNITFYYYEPALKYYIPLDTVGTAADSGVSVPNSDGKSANAPADLRRDFDFICPGLSTDTDNSFALSAGASSLGDGSASTFAYCYLSYTGSSVGYQYDYLCLQLPQLEGYLEDFDIDIVYQYYIDGDAKPPATNDCTWEIFDVSYNGSATPAPADATSVIISGEYDSTDETGPAYSAEQSVSYTLHAANKYQANYSYPYQLKICFRTSNTAGGNVVLRCRITELKVKVIVKQTDESGGLNSSLGYYVNTLKYLYTDEDGPVNVWDAALITEPQQAHREILQTHLGLVTGDINTTSWDNVETIKNGWTIRMWEMLPRPAREILEQLQFEGGFIAFWSGQDIKYVCVEDSYDAGDVVHTLDEDDYANLQIYISPLDEIVTKRIYQYDRDPATDELLSSVVISNVFDAAARTKWNMSATENIEEIELQYLIASVSGGANPNSSVGNYYANILESPRVIGSCDVKNPVYWDLEQGDIIKINDSYFTPFGKAWADLYFMIIETRRTRDNLSITIREVYEA